MSNVIEHENFLFTISFDHKLVFVVTGEIDRFGVFGLGELGAQSNHHLYLLLSVYTTTTTHTQILIINPTPNDLPPQPPNKRQFYLNFKKRTQMCK